MPFNQVLVFHLPFLLTFACPAQFARHAPARQPERVGIHLLCLYGWQVGMGEWAKRGYKAGELEVIFCCPFAMAGDTIVASLGAFQLVLIRCSRELQKSCPLLEPRHHNPISKRFPPHSALKKRSPVSIPGSSAWCSSVQVQPSQPLKRCCCTLLVTYPSHASEATTSSNHTLIKLLHCSPTS